jgi:3alpha(or 20beta)-hydroxysteroid dehydrogenase
VGRLDGKVALVTGAARGTGEATARLFVAEGARVLIGDVRSEEGAAAARALGPAAAFEPLDVTSETDWARAVAACVERFGRLDVLVNNAAVLHLAALEDTALADFERVVRVNQVGPFLGMRAVAPVLRAGGGGSIVNVASVDALQGKNGVVAYAATKWALRGMTKVAAAELGRDGIRVNAVCPEAGSAEMIAPYVPAGVDPRSIHAFGQPFLPRQRERSVEQRLRDVALMILFLASDESLSCTGGDFPVEGGNASLRRARGAPGDAR